MSEKEKTKICLIEDDVVDVMNVERSLSKLHANRFGFFKASNLEDGLKILKEEEIDVVLVDLNLPDSSGLETLKRVILEVEMTPVIVLTGGNDLELGELAVKEGAQDFLVKGVVDGKAIDRVIRYSIERQRLLVQVFKVKKRKNIEILAGEMVHDLNNLFTVILGFSDLLMEKTKKSDVSIHQNLKSIREAGEKGCEILQRLLTATKNHKGVEKPDEEKIEKKEVQQAVSEDKGECVETILFVEDEEVLRTLGVQALTPQGYNVITAADGKEGLKLIQEDLDTQKIDLVVSDVIMPEMGGPEMVREAWKLRPDLKVIFMSGYTDKKLSQEDEKVKMESIFIQKPFVPSTLIQEIKKTLF